MKIDKISLFTFLGIVFLALLSGLLLDCGYESTGTAAGFVAFFTMLTYPGLIDWLKGKA